MADDRIARASLFLASGTIVSRLLGFLKAIVLAATIGVVGSASADAFAVANGLLGFARPRIELHLCCAGGCRGRRASQVFREKDVPSRHSSRTRKPRTLPLVVRGDVLIARLQLAFCR